MTSKELEAALADAEDAFQRRPENPEVGLEYVSDSDILQLRKACRLLDAAGFLLGRNGHYTVIIESSFVAIERSIQFYVGQKGYDVAGQRNTEVYELGVRAGLFSRDIADRLEELWIENRSESYYRTGVAGEYRAQTIHRLAVQYTTRLFVSPGHRTVSASDHRQDFSNTTSVTDSETCTGISVTS